MGDSRKKEIGISALLIQTIYHNHSNRNFVQCLLDSPANLFLGIRSNLLDRYVGNIKVGPIDENHGVGELGIMIGDKKFGVKVLRARRSY